MRFEIFLMIVTTCLFPIEKTTSQLPGDIIGEWISLQQNVIVDIYEDHEVFKAKVIWFDDSDDLSRPMISREDSKNPVKALRTRKVLGLEVLTGLSYNSRCKCWQNGKIYDVLSGKLWDASIDLESKNLLKVRGFWHFEIFGKSMSFKRVEPGAHLAQPFK